jgi:putative FmdB family regulatory protein
MPLFNFACHTCEYIEEDVLLKKHDDDHLCEDCGEAMEKLPSLFAFKMKNSWLTKMERKWGRQGDPYRDEEGKTRPGVDDSIPHIPGPKTAARQKYAKKKMAYFKEKG